MNLLSFIRKNAKNILIVVSVVFILSMFYGIGQVGFQNPFSSQRKKYGLAKVNGKEVDAFRYNQFLGKLLSEQKTMLSPYSLLYYQYLALSQLIDFTIIEQESAKHFDAKPEEIKRAVDEIMSANKIPDEKIFNQILKRQGFSLDNLRRMIKEEIIVNKMNNKIASEVSITPDDLREIRVQHILFRTISTSESQQKEIKKQAEEVLKMAKSGADFSALAEKYSQDPGSAEKGGDLGFFGKGKMVKEFEDAAFSLKPGEISDLIKTDFGYHIIKMLESRPIENINKDEILKQKQARAFDDWYSKLRKKAKIEIENPMLKAFEAIQTGDLNKASQEFSLVAKQEPQNPYPHYFLAQLYERQGDFSSAVKEYEVSSSLSQNDPLLSLYIGQGYLNISSNVSKESANIYKDYAEKEFSRASALAADNLELREFLYKFFMANKLSNLANLEKEKMQQIEKRKNLEEQLKNK